MRCILSSSFWFFRISPNKTSLIFIYSLAIVMFLVISCLTRVFCDWNRLSLKYSLCYCTCESFWCHRLVNSYHLTLPNFVVCVKLVIKMQVTVFTNAVYHSEMRIFDQFFIVIIINFITSIGFNLKTAIKQFVRSWKSPIAKLLNRSDIK